ncbi:MAG: FAD-binding oxidoreductase [Rhodospirillaceae bacterium]|jgi:glycolate oxidase|nr:FAD-binding oxidoreductase [Rhodospirillaceae bacterium]
MNTHSTLDALSNLVGADNVLTENAEVSFYTSDLFFEGVPAMAVIALGSRAELANAVKLCVEAGIAVLPRGGGLSYTAGYVQDDASLDAIVLDTRRLNQILDVNPDNMTITVESGCTWEQVSKAAAEHGLRVTMPGPTTGRYSTIGGSLSNNSMFFSSAKTGTAADAVVGLEVVTADGTLITTGSGAINNGVPFFRNNGPDLTGLFLSDAGSLGIKTAATLRLEPVPAGTAFTSVAFESFEQMIPAVQTVGRSGLATECLAVGAIGGEAGPSLHLTVEGYSQDIADAQLAALIGLMGPQGQPQEPMVPTFIHENGFGFVQSPLDPKGRLQIWTHGVFAIGQTLDAYKALRAVLDKHQTAMTEHGVDATMSFACAGIAMMVEPVLFWASKPTPLHLQGMAKVEAGQNTASDSADSLVREIRNDIRTAMDGLGAAHMQYGRFYRYADATAEKTVELLAGIKRIVDPDRKLNPGVLGI